MKHFLLSTTAIVASTGLSFAQVDVNAMATSAYRNFETPGVSASGVHNPSKADIRAIWLAQHGLNYNIAGSRLAPTAVQDRLGYTPFNRAGDTLSGPIQSTTLSPLVVTGGSAEAHPWMVNNTGGSQYQYVLPNAFGVYDSVRNQGAYNYDWLTGVFSAPKFQGDGSLLTGLPSSGSGGDTLISANGAVSSPSAACANDATTGIQAAATVAATLKVTQGFWCYNGPISLPNNALKIECAPGGYLVKINATNDGIVSGNTLPATFDDFVIRDCTLLTKSGVTPTAGSMVHTKNGRRVTIDNTFVGTRSFSSGGTIKHSYNAFEFEGVDSITFSNSGAWGSVNDCILAYGTSSSFNSELRITNNSQLGGCTQKGIHIGGGLGGIYCESVDEVTSGTGTFFDRSIYNVVNREFFMSLDCDMDSNTSHGFYFAPNSIQTIRGAPWASSNGGDGLQVASPQDTTNTHVQIMNAHMYGNGTHGLNLDAGHVTVIGGTFFNNGASGSGSGILLFGAGVQAAQIDSVRTYLNHDYGVDNQANANITQFGPIYSTGNLLAPWRSVNALLAPLMPLPTTCTSQPTGGLRNNAGAVNVC